MCSVRESFTRNIEIRNKNKDDHTVHRQHDGVSKGAEARTVRPRIGGTRIDDVNHRLAAKTGFGPRPSPHKASLARRIAIIYERIDETVHRTLVFVRNSSSCSRIRLFPNLISLETRNVRAKMHNAGQVRRNESKVSKVGEATYYKFHISLSIILSDSTIG